ncbi:hypothetical protein [Thorsellia anophelis]|uniref:Protein CopB n=1 Tax=Thorsellia anophelis DSM 18579 TaxID=1123402 RepID=A0A1H9YFN7_9GAMM|nr:hypothetical protein [Thorsellia anophelis]SES67368.1 hypothetical protein SAMN02583745_00217 [Thorsellia anophelis DSM 18579]
MAGSKITNAQRQQAYRKRHKANNGRRIDVQCSLDAVLHLDLIEKYQNKTKKQVIEDLLAQEVKKIWNEPTFNTNDYI